jgi:hypothetical protein
VSPVVITLVVVIGLLVASILWSRRERDRPPSDERILFPFVGQRLSDRALQAALRLSRAEGATLVPAYLIIAPLHLALDAPMPRAVGDALPMLEAVEQRAARAGIEVDTRIEVGRSYRDAIARLLEHEKFARIVVAASTSATDGLPAGDVAWLLDHAPGEIVVLRPRREAEQERKDRVAA